MSNVSVHESVEDCCWLDPALCGVEHIVICSPQIGLYAANAPVGKNATLGYTELNQGRAVAEYVCRKASVQSKTCSVDAKPHCETSEIGQRRLYAIPWLISGNG